jgi:hypothetical protein
MRVVTSQATDAAVTRVETGAFRKPVRLETNRHHTLGLNLFHVGRRPVTGAAELYQVAGG